VPGYKYAQIRRETSRLRARDINARREGSDRSQKDVSLVSGLKVDHKKKIYDVQLWRSSRKTDLHQANI